MPTTIASAGPSPIASSLTREVASLRSCRQTFAESRPDLTSYLHLELVHQACLRDG